jgi:PKD repeat protein
MSRPQFKLRGKSINLRLLIVLIAGVCAVAALTTSGIIGTKAAMPANGTLTNNSGPITYTAGPFLVPNPTAQAGDGPICNAATPCDDFILNVNVTPGTQTNYKVKIAVAWPVSTADFDVYILQGANTVATAASSSDPEVAFLAATSGQYTVRVVPFAPAGQSITGTISLEQIPPAPPAGSGIAPRYKNYNAPPTATGAESAGEPSIGIDWNPNVPSLKHDKVNTGGVAFFTANLNELRVSFDDCSSPALDIWEDKTSPTESAQTLDPIGFVDHQTGRVFQSQLVGASSIMAFSDDDGETYTQSQGSGQPAGADHQTVGGGPYNETATPPPVHPLYPNQVYYCSQDIATAFCARSDDGGLTFNPGIPIYNLTQCGGLHGHVKVGTDGAVYVPNKSCGSESGTTVSLDNGLTWNVRTVPGSSPGDSDPSIGVAAGGGIYFGYQNGDGHPHIAHSTDHGTTWTDRDVGNSFIQNCVFPEVVAGDANRAAFGFVGTPAGGNYQDQVNFHGIWHFYIASTFDGGNTYQLVDATPGDPVQIGSICTSGTTCGGDRNLLDFNDIQMDKEGRVLAAYADGCVAPGCVESPASPSSSSRSALASIIRQSGGRRLLAAFDPVEPKVPEAPLVDSATRESNGVLVQWEEPDNGGSPITGYKIFRGTTSGGEGATPIATVGPDVTKYLDTTAAPNSNYFYRVTAFNAIGDGSFCREVSVTGAIIPESACALPGITIVTDPINDQTGAPANTQLDIQKVSIAEPFLNSCTGQLVFTMKVTDLAVLPPQARWTIFFSRANGTEYFVDMVSNDPDNPTGASFHYGHTEAGTGGVRTQSTDGLADAGSTYSPDGTIVIVISTSKLTTDGMTPPGMLPPPAPGDQFGNVNALTQQTIGVLLARIDDTGAGTYTIAGNLACQPNTAPIAALTASPTTGTAPLTVNFNASASSDPDMCDSVTGYVFDFGDGTAPVTQASPMVSHVYTSAGNYGATVKAKDSRNQLSANTALVVIQVSGTAMPTPVTNGDVTISEFRTRGPNGSNDEFIELYNRLNSPVVVGSTDGSAGWIIATPGVGTIAPEDRKPSRASTRATSRNPVANGGVLPRVIVMIPNGTTIPAHGHYLLTNSNTMSGPYSLNAYTPGNQTFTQDIPDNSGIALFTIATPGNVSLANRLDAVGFGTVDTLYSEGTGLTPGSGISTNVEHSFVRKLPVNGASRAPAPQDTNNNAADFTFVSTSGDFIDGAQSTLGAPGPESTLSPVYREEQVFPSYVDPSAPRTGGANRVRQTCGSAGTPPCDANSTGGFLLVRRKFTNTTSSPVTKLRFRIVDLTTLGNSAPSEADFRALNSDDVTVTIAGGAGTAQVKGTTLDATPNQTSKGGGVNSTYNVQLPSGGLAPGSEINVQWRLGVVRSGVFRFFIAVEALP